MLELATLIVGTRRQVTSRQVVEIGFLVGCDELDGDHLLRDLQSGDFGLLGELP
ncbi:MAG: hypothetical protein PHX35_03300 [Candidatus Bipolaricaulis anaerobius]|nr:hypothetical protein [Candidatus Bipolaricaulis anaerobius]